MRHQRQYYESKLIYETIQDLTEKVAHETTGYLSQWNQIGPLHAEFIRSLSQSYVEQLLGEDPRRTVWAAHPGLGKTTCLRFFLLNVIRFLRTGYIPSFANRGILVCSNQVTELEDHILFLQKHLGEEIPEVGLFHHKTNSKEFNRRVEVADHNLLRDFPILFATQNLIRKRGADLHRTKQLENFERLGSVAYTHDGVRLLCWDEEAIATKASHVNIDTLREFRRRHQKSGFKQLNDFVDVVVDGVLRQVDHRIDQETAFNIAVPQLDSWDAKDVRLFLNSTKAAKEYGENYIRQARQLANWHGDSAVIHYRTNTASNDASAIVMDYVIEIPSNLDRAVVTDASAAINKLIQLDKGLTHSLFMQLHGHELKRYDHVRLYIQPMPSGRTSFLDGEQITTAWKVVLMDVIPKIRQLSPPGPSLIITFKGTRSTDQYIKQIQQLVNQEDSSQLHFTTYGKHRGDNQWSNCTSVFLAGTFHRDEGELSSLARSQTRKPLDNTAQPYTTKELVHSQTAADIQQALARGCCREVMTVGDTTQAKPMNAFVGLSKRELPHVVKHLRDCFPGIQIIDLATGDNLVEEELLSLKSKLQKGLIDYLTVSQDIKVKSASIKEIIEGLLGCPINPTLWTKAQRDVNIPGWIKQGHSWIRISQT